MSGKYIEFTMDRRSVKVTVMQGREMLVKGRVLGTNLEFRERP